MTPSWPTQRAGTGDLRQAAACACYAPYAATLWTPPSSGAQVLGSLATLLSVTSGKDVTHTGVTQSA